MCRKSSSPTAQLTKSTSSQQSKEPSLIARYTCVAVLLGFMAVWAKFTFVPENAIPGVHVPMHSWKGTLFLTVLYLVSLPVLRMFTDKFILSSNIDVKLLLKESMIVYNVAQVILNGWMVYRFIDAVMNKGHPFIGDITTVNTGASYAVWVHYCDKYLEFFDTYFMVLRGKMNQVSFLHVYHHTTIAWAWYAAMSFFPGGDSYFGALFNSWIHVMMYSYYALALLRVPCPWKRFLTMAQLIQFLSVNVYTGFAYNYWDKSILTNYHLLAMIIQLGEMTSLFVLFFSFYKKSYSNKKKKVKDDEDDQCQKAVGELTSTAKEAASAAYNVASKESSKLLNTAKKAAQCSGTLSKNVDAMSRPSWSMVN